MIVFKTNAQQQQGSNAAAQKLRYLCLKNLADVNETQGNANAAIKYYIEVVTSSLGVWSLLIHKSSLLLAGSRDRFERRVSLVSCGMPGETHPTSGLVQACA